MNEAVSTNLADNLVAIRGRRNWSQSQLAQRADIPRSTVANMESGSGNPSLSNLARVCAALGVGLEELVARPRSDSKLIRQADVPVRNLSHGRVRISKLLPERVRGLEIDRMDFDAGASVTLLNWTGEPIEPAPKPAGRVLATCGCEEPRGLRISASVLDLGPIDCGLCRLPFLVST